MYKEHKVIVIIFSVIVIALELILKLDYYEIADHSISVMSIALGIYIAALTGLLGSKSMSALKNTPDLRVPGKDKLGVLLSYFKQAMFCGLMTIILSYVSIFANSEKWFEAYPDVILLISIAGFILLALNFLYMWLLFSFVINSIVHEA